MKKKLFLLTTLALTLGLSACGSNQKSIIPSDPYDDGEVKTPYEEYDNGVRITKITLKEDSAAINFTTTKTYQIQASFEPSDAYNDFLFYDSNNESVAEVDEDGLVTFKDNGDVSVVVSSDTGVTSACHFTVYTPIEQISISPASILPTGYVMDITEDRQFSTTFTPASASQTEINWSVVDEDGKASQLAAISNNGLLSVSAPKGTKNVVNYVVATSKYYPEVSAREKITINDDRVYAESVSIYNGDDNVSETTIDMNIGDSLTLSAKTNPEVTTGGIPAWSSSDSTVVTVNNGVIEVINGGTLENPVTAKVFVEIDGKSNWVNINAKKVPVSSVTVSESAVALRKGETATISATVLPANASIKDVNYAVIEGNNFASIDKDGVITALNTGVATIKVSSLDDTTIYDTCTVTVTNTIQSISIDDIYSTVEYGGKQYQLTATSVPVDADAYDVTWEVNDPSLATISNTGVLTTNNTDTEGTVLVTVKVTGSDPLISNSKNIKIVRPVGPFTANNEYLVGNRNFDGSTISHDTPSWDDSSYARILTKNTEVSGFEAEWYVNGITLYAYNALEDTGDQFIVRSEGYHLTQTNSAANNKAKYVDGTANFTVAKDDQYDLYFQKLTEQKAAEMGTEYLIYAESVFADGYYFVGNKDYHTGTSTGAADNSNWINKASAFKFIPNTAQTEFEEYSATVTLSAGDKFRFRNAEWFDTTIKTGSTDKVFINGEGNFEASEAGKYSFYFAPSYGNNQVYISKEGEPTEPTYSYQINTGEKVFFSKDGSTEGQFNAEGITLKKNDTLKIFDKNDALVNTYSINDNGKILLSLAEGVVTSKVDTKVSLYYKTQGEDKDTIYVTTQIDPGFYVINSDSSWAPVDGEKVAELPVLPAVETKYNADVSSGDTFKFVRVENGVIAYMDPEEQTLPAGLSTDANKNYVASADGNYDFYLKNTNYVYVEEPAPAAESYTYKINDGAAVSFTEDPVTTGQFNAEGIVLNAGDTIKIYDKSSVLVSSYTFDETGDVLLTAVGGTITSKVKTKVSFYFQPSNSKIYVTTQIDAGFYKVNSDSSWAPVDGTKAAELPATSDPEDQTKLSMSVVNGETFRFVRVDGGHITYLDFKGTMPTGLSVVDGNLVVSTDGDFDFYLKNSNEVYVAEPAPAERVITLTVPNWTNNDGACAWAWVWGDGFDAHWIKSSNATAGATSTQLTIPSSANGMVVVRAPANATPDPITTYGSLTPIHNQTGDITINSATTYVISFN